MKSIPSHQVPETKAAKVTRSHEGLSKFELSIPSYKAEKDRQIQQLPFWSRQVIS